MNVNTGLPLKDYMTDICDSQQESIENDRGQYTASFHDHFDVEWVRHRVAILHSGLHAGMKLFENYKKLKEVHRYFLRVVARV